MNVGRGAFVWCWDTKDARMNLPFGTVDAWGRRHVRGRRVDSLACCGVQRWREGLHARNGCRKLSRWLIEIHYFCHWSRSLPPYATRRWLPIINNIKLFVEKAMADVKSKDGKWGRTPAPTSSRRMRCGAERRWAMPVTSAIWKQSIFWSRRPTPTSSRRTSGERWRWIWRGKECRITAPPCRKHKEKDAKIASKDNGVTQIVRKQWCGTNRIVLEDNGWLDVALTIISVNGRHSWYRCI